MGIHIGIEALHNSSEHIAIVDDYFVEFDWFWEWSDFSDYTYISALKESLSLLNQCACHSLR